MMSKTVLRSVITEQLSRKLTFQLSKNIHQVARLSNTALTNEQVAKVRIANKSKYDVNHREIIIVTNVGS